MTHRSCYTGWTHACHEERGGDTGGGLDRDSGGIHVVDADGLGGGQEDDEGVGKTVVVRQHRGVGRPIDFQVGGTASRRVQEHLPFHQKR